MELFHAIHHWQHAAQQWLASGNPLTVDAVMLVAMTLEGMGVPGIPGEVPMLAQAGLIDAGRQSYPHAVVVGVVANFLGSMLGYQVGTGGNQWIPQRWRGRLTEGAARLAASPHSGWLILVSRNFGALRTPVTWGAGAGRYPLGAFAGWALAGAVIHVGLWQYAMWKGTGFLTHLHPRQLLILLAVAAIAGLLWLLLRPRLTAKKNDLDE